MKESFEIESYALFKNVDETILMLNPIILKDGYEFQAFGLEEIEQNFSNLYSLPNGYQSRMQIKFETGDTVSKEFYEVYQNHTLGDHILSDNYKIILLKKTKTFQKVIIDKKLQLGDSAYFSNKMKDFTSRLIMMLRLFKNGKIISPAQFQISKVNRHVWFKLTRNFVKSPTDKCYSLNYSEIEKLRDHLGQNFETNGLTRLAETYFENCYELRDDNTKLINLITALESIFNRSKDQISHIIARHLSLIISTDHDEFEMNYKRIKKLYGYRSQIVHGQNLKIKEDIKEVIDELCDLTRKAILYCMDLDMSKDELFNYLNSKGF